MQDLSSEIDSVPDAPELITEPDTPTDSSPTDSSPADVEDSDVTDTTERDLEPDDSRDAVSDDALDADSGPGCHAAPFEFIDIPEASGAANLGEGRYLVVADSGHGGQALVIDHMTGISHALHLPLGSGAGDDLEGLEAAPDGRIFGLTSAGFLRAWRIVATADGAEAELVFGPTAISDDEAWVCAPMGVNCGPNYEGLCIHPAPTGDECAGWAASKTHGDLLCLRASDDGYVVDASVRRTVFPEEHLSACTFSPDPPYRLFVGGNIYSGDTIIEVESDRLVTLATGAAQQEALLALPRPTLRVDDGAPAASSFQLLSFGDWQTFGEGRSPRVILDCR